MKRILKLAALLPLLVASACVTVPTGPSSMALPGTGRGWDQFRFDDGDCRQFAQAQVGGMTPDQAGVTSGVNSAAVGTLLGAAAGAAINGGQGAAVGAGAGLALGGLAGTGTANASSYELQRRYDNAYLQCMYAKGHRVPVYGDYSSSRPAPRAYAPAYPPPPPAR